jgi:hypothetical protein
VDEEQQDLQCWMSGKGIIRLSPWGSHRRSLLKRRQRSRHPRTDQLLEAEKVSKIFFGTTSSQRHTSSRGPVDKLLLPLIIYTLMVI